MSESLSLEVFARSAGMWRVAWRILQAIWADQVLLLPPRPAHAASSEMEYTIRIRFPLKDIR